MSEFESDLDAFIRGKLTRKQFIVSAAAAGLSLTAIGGVLAACGQGSQSGQTTHPPSKPTGTITFGNPEPPTSANWDPHLGFGLADQQTWSLVYDTLLQKDATGKIIGRLATSFQRTSATTLRVAIHQGVKFVDGTRLTSDVVQASFNRLSDPKSGLPFAGLNPAFHVQIIDDHTFDVVTDRPYGPLEESLAQSSIVAPNDIKNPDNFKKGANGTGPYRFVSYSNNTVTLEANQDYFGGAPASEKIALQYIGDPDARRNALLTGEIDVFTRSSSIDLDAVKGNSGFYVNNSSPASYSAYLPIFDTILADVRLRQALAYAIDRATIAHNILKIDKPMASSLVRSNLGFKALGPSFEYNPTKAKQLMSEAGYPNGFGLTFASANFLPHQQEIDQVVTDKYLKAVGIQAQVARLETGTFRTNWSKYAMSYNTLGGTSSDPDTIFAPFQPIIAEALLHWKNPQLGPLYDAQRFAVGNDRLPAITTMAQYLWNQQANIYIADDIWYTIASSKVKNYHRAPVVGEPLLTKAWKAG